MAKRKENQVYLVPFNNAAYAYTLVRVQATPSMTLPQASTTPTPIRHPNRGLSLQDWPHNLCFDWAWGVSILKTFGTSDAHAYTRLSPISARIATLHQARKRKLQKFDESDDGDIMHPAKRRQTIGTTFFAKDMKMGHDMQHVTGAVKGGEE